MLNRIPRKEMRRFAAFASLGFEMVAPIVLGLALDMGLGTGPWLVILGVFLGFVGSFAHLFVLLRRFEAQDKARASRPGSPEEP